MKVPWMPKLELSKKADDVLDGYQDLMGHPIRPPVPVKDIIKGLLGLKLAYLDFEEKLGMKDVLGATYVNARVICVNEKLNDSQHEGRMAFTCAHEVGHWELHREWVNAVARSEGGEDVILCRAKDAKQPIEWQADYFAGCLLIPEKDVKRAFQRAFGRECLEILNEKSTFRGSPLCFDPSVENWHFIARAVCETGGFSNVSKQAMAIRLQELGLLVNLTGRQMTWEQSAMTA
jgi:Zn-dependent peptidase ImmA (M78 family)